MKRGDVWIVGVLLVVAAGFMVVPRLSGGQEAVAAVKYAEITVDGAHYRTVALDGADQEIDIRTSRGHNVLKVSRGGIAMIDADCPDKLCIAMGRISAAGGKIVCLPHRVFVEIVAGDGGASGGGYDAVVN